MKVKVVGEMPDERVQEIKQLSVRFWERYHEVGYFGMKGKYECGVDTSMKQESFLRLRPTGNWHIEGEKGFPEPSCITIWASGF
jgi:hypothetical protein